MKLKIKATLEKEFDTKDFGESNNYDLAQAMENDPGWMMDLLEDCEITVTQEEVEKFIKIPLQFFESLVATAKAYRVTIREAIRMMQPQVFYDLEANAKCYGITVTEAKRIIKILGDVK